MGTLGHRDGKDTYSTPSNTWGEKRVCQKGRVRGVLGENVIKGNDKGAEDVKGRGCVREQGEMGKGTGEVCQGAAGPHHVLVDVIRDDGTAVSLCQLQQVQQVLVGVHRATGVAGVVYNQRRHFPRLLHQQTLKVSKVNLPPLLRLQGTRVQRVNSGTSQYQDRCSYLWVPMYWHVEYLDIHIHSKQ